MGGSSNTLTNKTVLVTGATGFIGSHFVNEYKTKSRTVCLVRDFLPSPWVKWISEALTPSIYVRGDILDQNLIRRVLAEYSVSEVYHFAAQAVVASALKDPFGTFQTNIMGTVNLLEACRQVDVERIYVQSTDKVYGEGMGAKETHPLVSTGGPYPTSKACQDLIAQTYKDTYGLQIIIGRASNTYGYDMASRIVSNTIRSCLRGEQPALYTPLHRDTTEETVRQYIYVEDLAHAIKFLMSLISQAEYIFNIGTDDILNQEQVVRAICNHFPQSPRLVTRETPIKEIQKQSLDWSKLKNLGWQPQHTFEGGLRKTIAKFRHYGG